jgi:probable rRNA maturation factor
MIQLNWENEQTSIELPDELLATLQLLTALIAQTEQLADGEVGLLFVDNDAIQQMNAEYRDLDKPTDVLSFAIQEAHEDELNITFGNEADMQSMPNLYGDIVISVERAREQAIDYNHSLLREICFLYVHGFLHLLGYDHHDADEERRMMERQQHILAKAGIDR